MRFAGSLFAKTSIEDSPFRATRHISIASIEKGFADILRYVCPTAEKSRSLHRPSGRIRFCSGVNVPTDMWLAIIVEYISCAEQP